MRRAIFAGVIWVVFALGCAPASSGPPASAPSSLLSQGAPELHRPTLDQSGAPGSAPFSLRDLRGRLVIVDFFAEYCQPCMRTLPELERLRQSRSNISIVGVAEDPDAETSLKLVRDLGLGFPVVFDRDHVLAGRYRIDGLPATFVLDRQGVVRWASNGACSRSELEAVLDSLK
jgi:thiol-disulfide isomerase/thioredoxin